MRETDIYIYMKECLFFFPIFIASVIIYFYSYVVLDRY